jgi:GH24 family phage-related lysozyme (muramidase)
MSLNKTGARSVSDEIIDVVMRSEPISIRNANASINNVRKNDFSNLTDEDLVSKYESLVETSKHSATVISALDAVGVELRRRGIYVDDTNESSGDDNKKLASWLKNIEAPYRDEDYILVNGKRVAIKPHSANDGYVTMGYGHAIQSDDDAKKYGFETGSKQSVSAVINSITTQTKKYASYLENPAILSSDEAEKILADDLISYRERATYFANETGELFSQNQMDAMTSLVYNGNKAYSLDSLLYYFLRRDKAEALNIIRKADSSGWYRDNLGLLRRRLMEFNIFFNNDYTFFGSNQLNELKNITGF